MAGSGSVALLLNTFDSSGVDVADGTAVDEEAATEAKDAVAAVECVAVALCKDAVCVDE